MKTWHYGVYFRLLSHALLWLYLSSNSYFLPLLSHKTNSYYLRAWLPSVLNKNTHREKKQKPASSADQLTKNIRPSVWRECVYGQNVVKYSTMYTQCRFLRGGAIQDVFVYTVRTQTNHAVSRHNTDLNFVSLSKRFCCWRLITFFHTKQFSDAIFLSLYKFTFSET